MLSKRAQKTFPRIFFAIMHSFGASRRPLQLLFFLTCGNALRNAANFERVSPRCIIPKESPGYFQPKLLCLRFGCIVSKESPGNLSRLLKRRPPCRVSPPPRSKGARVSGPLVGVSADEREPLPGNPQPRGRRWSAARCCRSWASFRCPCRHPCPCRRRDPARVRARVRAWALCQAKP